VVIWIQALNRPNDLLRNEKCVQLLQLPLLVHLVAVRCTRSSSALPARFTARFIQLRASCIKLCSKASFSNNDKTSPISPIVCRMQVREGQATDYLTQLQFSRPVARLRERNATPRSSVAAQRRMSLCRYEYGRQRRRR